MYLVNYKKNVEGLVPNQKTVEHTRILKGNYEDVIEYVEWLKTVRCTDIVIEEYRLVGRETK